MVEKSDQSVAVIAVVVDSVGSLLVENVIEVLKDICRDIVTEPVVELDGSGRWNKKGMLSKAASMLYAEIRMCASLGRLRDRFDVCFVHTGEYWNLIPIVFSKLLRKKVVIFHLGGHKVNQERLNATNYLERRLMPPLVSFLITLAYSLSDVIAVESARCIEFGGLGRFRYKMFVTGGRYLDTGLFEVVTRTSKRPKLVGYVGAFRPVKGILNLLEAFPLIARRLPDVGFRIGGEGILRETIMSKVEMLRKEGIDVAVTEWINHAELPSYLNLLRVLVLPSYSEGIPGIIQEAMACGTVVVATPVGGIPELVCDSKTGFVLDRNEPEAIAEKVVSVLSRGDLDKISRRACEFICRRYEIAAVRQRYLGLLERSMQGIDR